MRIGNRNVRRRGYASSARGGAPRRSGFLKGRLLIAAAVAGFALLSYCSKSEYNEATGETQYISMTPEQEIALGLQAMPEMVKQHGGLYPDDRLQNFIDKVGNDIVNSSAARETGWQFEFHLLRDPELVNAFALPGGQVFITYALFSRMDTPGQLAGVLGHEVGHVVARHGAQRMAKAQLTQGLAGAVAVGAGSEGSAQVAQMIGQVVNMKYGREDEIESDTIGVKYMADAGYDPRSMIDVMRILKEASGGRSQPEFFSTHPDPDNRIERIEEAIRTLYPNGVPSNLQK